MSDNKNDIRAAFKNQFPHFYGQSHDFSDPPDDGSSDEDIARNMQNGISAHERTQFLSYLIADSNRILEAFDSTWMDLHIIVNRRFINQDTARQWLLSVQGAWQSELDRLRS